MVWYKAYRFWTKIDSDTKSPTSEKDQRTASRWCEYEQDTSNAFEKYNITLGPRGQSPGLKGIHEMWVSGGKVSSESQAIAVPSVQVERTIILPILIREL